MRAVHLRRAVIAGPARFDACTKRLLHRLRPGDIALVAHRDLDQVTAEALAEVGVQAVVNLEPFVSGRYPARGGLVLQRRSVALFQALSGAGRLSGWPEARSMAIDVRRGVALAAGEPVARLQLLTQACLEAELAAARRALDGVLARFLENTLEWARRERSLLLDPVPVPPLRTPLRGRHALVVVRGQAYREDLRAIAGYIRERRPVCIGVDGGADALLEAGFRPHLIVGDMDSVSDRALRCGAELVVHAYPCGAAPGLARVVRLGLSAHLFPVPGTSEDAALLLAHEGGAELIVAVGTHTHVMDFLEKGRPGMASTLLVRCKVGPRLVDAKGVSQLHRAAPLGRCLAPAAAAAAAAAAVVAGTSPPAQELLRALWLGLRLALGL